MAQFARVKLLDAVTADTDGDWNLLRRVYGQDRMAGVFVVGDLGGGTVVIQGSPDDQTSAFTLRTWNDNQMTFSTNDYLSGPMVVQEVRARLTGSTGPSLTVYLIY